MSRNRSDNSPPRQSASNSETTSNTASMIAEGIGRVGNLVIGVLGQVYTIRETIYLLWDVSSGSLDVRFWVSLIAIGLVFPISLWLILRAIGDSQIVGIALNVYALSLSVVASAYYFAIFANYRALYNAIHGPAMTPDSPPPLSVASPEMLSHLGLFAIFMLPLLAAVVFSLRVGREVAGIASVPLMASFLYGCTMLVQLLRKVEFGPEFSQIQIPQIAMTTILFFAGMLLLGRFLPRP